MIRACVGLLACAWLLVGPVHAAAEDALGSCLDDARKVLDAGGAASEPRAGRAFLTEGDVRLARLRLDATGCIGVLAVGHEHVDDLATTLYTDGGIRLEQDASASPYGYIRYCGAAGLHLVLSIRVVRGRGEVRWLVLRRPPPVLPDLNRGVGGCFARRGGVVHGAADVGPEPSGGDLDAFVARLTRERVERGDRPLGSPREGTLARGDIASVPLSLRAGACYRVVAVGEASVTDLDARLHDPSGEVVAADVDRRRGARLGVCAEADGTYSLELRMYGGAGRWSVTAFELGAPPAPPPAGTHGVTRARYVRMARRMASFGLGPVREVWGYTGSAHALSIPLRARAGRCYALGAVRSDDLDRADLDLGLVDADGRLLARDTGPGPEPLVFHCASRDERLTLRAHVNGGRGRFLVLVGGDAGPEAP